MKKFILFLLLGLPFIGFSQIDTTKFPLPKRVAKEVVKDLVSGDSAKAVLKLTEEQLKKTDDMVISKDSVITLLSGKNTNYIEQIREQKEKSDIYQQNYTNLQKDYKKLKAKNTFNKILYYVIIGGLTYLYINK